MINIILEINKLFIYNLILDSITGLKGNTCWYLPTLLLIKRRVILEVKLGFSNK